MILETLETGMLTATAHTLEQDVVQNKIILSFINDMKDVKYKIHNA